MSRIALSLWLLCLLAPLWAQTPKPAKWVVVKPAEQPFRFQMPGQPKEETRTLASAVGAIPHRQFLYTAPDKTAFLVAYSVLPPEKMKNANPEALLNEARDGPLRSRGGTLVEEKKIQLGGHPGRDLTFKKPDETVIRARIYLVKNRLYQTLVWGKNPDAVRFLDSFKFNDAMKLN